MSNATDPRNDRDAGSEYDDTGERCENCGERIEDGAPATRRDGLVYCAGCACGCAECVPAESEAA
jgi:hypothetical protein